MEQAITLAKGGRARAFPYVKKDESVLFFTGRSLTVRYEIKNEVLAKLLIHFKDAGWFFLGNAMDNIKKGGLGEYFQKVLKMPVRHASHVAAFLVREQMLTYTYTDDDVIMLKVKQRPSI